MLKTYATVIVAENLNVKHTAWNSKVKNAKKRTRFEFADKRDIVVLEPNKSTHYRGVGKSDVLDIAVFQNGIYQSRIDTINNLSFDDDLRRKQDDEDPSTRGLIK